MEKKRTKDFCSSPINEKKAKLELIPHSPISYTQKSSSINQGIESIGQCAESFVSENTPIAVEGDDPSYPTVELILEDQSIQTALTESSGVSICLEDSDNKTVSILPEDNSCFSDGADTDEAKSFEMLPNLSSEEQKSFYDFHISKSYQSFSEFAAATSIDEEFLDG